MNNGENASVRMVETAEIPVASIASSELLALLIQKYQPAVLAIRMRSSTDAVDRPGLAGHMENSDNSGTPLTFDRFVVRTPSQVAARTVPEDGPRLTDNQWVAVVAVPHSVGMLDSERAARQALVHLLAVLVEPLGAVALLLACGHFLLPSCEPSILCGSP